jgi:hypothetical protein
MQPANPVLKGKRSAGLRGLVCQLEARPSRSPEPITRFEPRRKCGRADEVAEHRRQPPAFGIVRSQRIAGCCRHAHKTSAAARSIYVAGALVAGLAICFNIASRVFAAGPEEFGFCPVINRPSLTT